MLVAISRNSEAKAMMRGETHTLRHRQRDAAASWEAVLFYIDISIRIYVGDGSGYCRGKFCFPLRRASARTRSWVSVFSRRIREVIGCLSVYPTILSLFLFYYLIVRYIHIYTDK